MTSQSWSLILTLRFLTGRSEFFAALLRFIGFAAFGAMEVFLMESLQSYRVAGDASQVVSFQLRFRTVEGPSYNNYVACSLLQGSYCLHL